MAKADTKVSSEKVQKASVVELSSGSRPVAPGREKPRPQRRRRHFLAFSFLLLVLAPVAVLGYFWVAVASDRYVSGAGFSVRSIEQGGGADLLGGLTGMASAGSTSSDSYMVMEFLESRAMVERVEARKTFTEMFSRSDVDPIFRMSRASGIEDKVAYWRSRIETSYDASSGIVEFEVEAFTREDARLLADTVLEEASTLVNKLSENARNESVANAEAEVRRAEDRLRKAMIDLRQFRDAHGDVDPTATAAAQLEIDTQVEAEITDLRARISVLAPKVSAKAPRLVMMRERLQSLESQIASAKDSEAKQDDISSRLEKYETITIEKQFAQQAYTTALSSLEKARVKADGQQRYLAVFSDPATPEIALRPQRLLNILLMTVCAIALWGIGVLVVYSVRDHLS